MFRYMGVHGGQQEDLVTTLSKVNEQLRTSYDLLGKIKNTSASIKVPVAAGTGGTGSGGGTLSTSLASVPPTPGPAVGKSGAMVTPGNVSFGQIPGWIKALGLAKIGITAGVGMLATAREFLPATEDSVAMQSMLHQMGTRQNVYAGASTRSSLLGTITGSIDQYVVGGRDQAMMAGYTLSGAGIQNQAMMKTLLSQNQGLSLMTGLPNANVAAAQAGFSSGPFAARALSFGIPVANIGTGDMEDTQQIFETMYKRMVRPDRTATPELIQESYLRGGLGANFRALGMNEDQQKLALQYFTERSRSKGPVNLSNIDGLKNLGYNEDNNYVMGEWSKSRSQLELMTKTFDKMALGSKDANKFLKGIYDTLSNLPQSELDKFARSVGALDTALSDPGLAAGLGLLSGLVGGLTSLFGMLAANSVVKALMGGKGTPGVGSTPKVTDLGTKVGTPSPWSPGATPKPVAVKPKAGGGVWGTILATAAATVGVQFLPDWLTGGDSPLASGYGTIDPSTSDQVLRDQYGMNDKQIDLFRRSNKAESVHSGGNNQAYTYSMDKLANKMEGLIGNSTAFGKSVYHRCLGNVQDAWRSIGGTNNQYWGTAAQAGSAARSKGVVNHGPAPRGALYLWNSSIGGGAGHIAVADGRGHAVNNWGGNKIERTSISQMKTGFIGWAYPNELLGKNPGDVKKGWLQGTGPEGGKAGGATGQAIADYARKFVGTPYRSGGRSPKGWDCAGFTWYVAKHFGITLATTAGGQLKNGTSVPTNQIRPGDLVIYGKGNSRAMNSEGHVAISLGGSRVIHAGKGGTAITSISGAAPGMSILGVRRIAGGSMGTGPGLTTLVGTGTPEATSGNTGYTAVDVSNAGMTVTRLGMDDVGGTSSTGSSGLLATIGTSAGADGSSPEDSGGGLQARGKSNKAKVWNMLMDKGFTAGAAAGILGNLQQESGVNPGSVQSGGPGRGIMQWTVNERWASMQKWAHSKGLKARSLETQVQWMLKEMKDYGVYNKMKGMKDVEDATLFFENKMERAGIPNMENRYKYAREALRQFGRGSYSQGSRNIPMDEDARVHAGEMILTASQAAAVRKEAANIVSGQRGGGHTFVINVPPGTVEDQAQMIARRVASILDTKASTTRLMEN